MVIMPMPFFLSFIMFFFCGCSVLPPEITEPVPSEQQVIMTGIDDLETAFTVRLTPWNDAGTRAQVSITNNTDVTLNWAVLHVAFINADGGVIKTESTGAHSQIPPMGTVNFYTDLPDINGTSAYVYAVDDNWFVNTPDQGITPNI